MGAAFAHNWQQMQSCYSFEEVFGVVQSQSWQILQQFHNRGRNVDSPQHIGGVLLWANRRRRRLSTDNDYIWPKKSSSTTKKQGSTRAWSLCRKCIRFWVAPSSTSKDLLYPDLNKWLGWKRFGSYDEIIAQTNVCCENLDISYYLDGVIKLETHSTKYINPKCDNVEK